MSYKDYFLICFTAIINFGVNLISKGNLEITTRNPFYFMGFFEK